MKTNQEKDKKTLDLGPLMSRKKVADYFDVSIQTIINYTKKGFLTAYKIRRKVFYRELEVMEAIQNGMVVKYQHETTREFIFRR